MDRKDLVQRLMITFHGELEELVHAIERDLLKLERSSAAGERAELFGSLFRSAHSLKGAARSVDVGAIEEACHNLEEIFAALRDGRMQPGPALFSLLYAAVDAVAEAGKRLQRGEDPRAGMLAQLLLRLSEVTTAPHAVTELPPSQADILPASAAFEPQEPEPTPLADEARVKIPARKLDALLEQGNELLLARSGCVSISEAFTALQARVVAAKAQVRAVSSLAAKLAEPPGIAAAARLGAHASGAPRLSQATRILADEMAAIEKSLQSLLITFEASSRALAHAAAPLEAEIRTVRMQPFADACDGLDRVVRDLTQDGSKAIELVVEGGQVEIDRSLVAGLRSPLRHLIRNAVDHGLETLAERRAAGKVPQGRITVAAMLVGEQVVVTVTDDGRGLQLEAIKEAVRVRGGTGSSDASDVVRQIFQSGLSTAQSVTAISGRGVGLDAVRSAIEELRGDVSVSSATGHGTCFSIRLPLTVTTTRALLVRCAGQTFAIESLHVQQLLRFQARDTGQLNGRLMLLREGRALPIVAMAEWLDLGTGAAAGNPSSNAVVLRSGQADVALLVDEFYSEQELVIRGLGRRLRNIEQFAGAAVLPDGRFALVLNPAAIGRGITAPRTQPPSSGPAVPVKRRLLVVDDSVTTRTLEQSALAAAGYEVLVACNGAEAWELLESKGADLVVTDVEMPRMDGIALTRAIRQSSEFRGVPVILVTARESEEDKIRGLQAGADAYLVKSTFDQQILLDTVARML